ncbi:D-Ala-D-Ala carboxypeptidase family metallohydrolase [Rhizobium sp.]
MDFAKFISTISAKLKKLNASQTKGFEIIVTEGTARGVQINRLAYILATAWWETANTMEPVKEAFFVSNDEAKAEAWRKKNLKYYPYYGRGYAQLTHDYNYKKAKEKYGVDFVKKPELALDTKYAVQIIFDGMLEGWFTGKALDDYIDLINEGGNADLDEYIKARKVVNGTNKAKEIADIAVIMEAALEDAGYDSVAGASLPTSYSSKFTAHIAGLGLSYFKPYEFLVKGSSHSNPGSSAFGLNTDPPESVWNNINATAKILDELRDQLQKPIVMSSVYRSPAYNKAIGGAKDSQHVDFNAIDFSVKGSSVGPYEWAAALKNMRSAGLFKGGIGIYSTFVHVDTRGTNADWTG